MAQKIVIAGGGVAGSLAAKLLERDAEVTVVTSTDYLELPYPTLRALVEPSLAKSIVIPYSSFLTEAKVVVGKIVGATNTEIVLESGETIQFDFLVIATGSKPWLPLRWEERIEYFEAEYRKIQSAQSFLVIGGGPVGVEFAGEIATDFPDKSVTLLTGGDRLIDFLGPKASDRALKFLKSKNVEVIFKDKLEVDPSLHGTKGVFKTKNGKEISADYLFIATGRTPDTSWLAGNFSEVIDQGRVKVDSNLRVEGYSNIFAIGDITNIKEMKQGYLATAHAHVAVVNIKKLLKSEHAPAKSLKKYSSGAAIAIVALGRHNAVGQFPFGTFTGYLPSNIKNGSFLIKKARAEYGLK
eukprot:TRINITY_DN3678_c0_g1_i1.p1 TRINITY_DN3678_c0_g1~~TRINITY_DN3678_c0_g1_i1.p1  ORF type:complete len:354 (+),score=58.80 TRINITY_DN3678_c0_g1_i1:359-1420(+)